MNAISKSTMEGELLSPRDMVRAVGKTHPLNGGRIDCLVRAGSSITEILIEALAERPDLYLRRDFIVHIDGHPIEEKNWSRVRVKKGATVTFTPRMQNGNSSMLRSVLGVVIAVAAIAIAGPAGAAFAGTAFATSIGISASVATALIAGGIILAGTLALNALFPVRPPADNNVESGSLISIQGAQNQADPFGPISVVLGMHRQSPRLAAKPYTEIVGDDQYLRLLFCPGYGPLSISDMKIGETALTSFSDYTIETFQGFAGDGDPTLYPGEVAETALSITLTAAGGWERQTTAAETDEISVDFTAAQGIVATDPQGADVPISVTVSTRYRLVGAVSWTNAPNVVFGRSYKPMRRGLNISVARGQYEVETTKVDAARDPKYNKDEVIWTALRSIKKSDPITFPHPLALVALRIKATDQLSGVISTFNCVTTSLVKAWNGSAWVADTASQWPPDLFRHVLQGPANARAVPDAEIDLDNLQDWWTFCISKGLKFNQVITSAGSVYDKLSDIAAAGRAVVTFIDGKWGVIWDQPDASIVQHFTPRNSWGFQGQRAYAQQPHGWRVSFINEDNGYTQDERIVYDDGYSSSNATLFEGIQFPGVTDPDLIWKHGRFHIAQSRLRPEKITLNVGWEHLVCTRGDRVRVTHDVMLIGLNSGRVKSISGQDVTFDEEVTIEASTTYGMQFRVPADARTIDRAVSTSVAGDYTTLTLVGDLTGIPVGALFAFGETDQESSDHRVQSISHQKDLIATLTLVADAPEISDADSGTIPAYDPNVTIPPDPFALTPRNLQYQELIDGQGASVRALVRLLWQVPRFGRIVSFEVQQRDDDIGGSWVTVDSVPVPRTTSDVPLTTKGVWSFRVRCIFQDGSTSAWVSLIGLNLAGLSSEPDDITNLHIRSVDGQTVLDWNVVTDPRLIYYEIRKGTSWDTGLVVGDFVTQPPWATTGDGTYHVRAYVLTPFNERVYSANVHSITVLDSIISRNIILSKDEKADGWPGQLEGGVIDGLFIRTDSGMSISAPWASEIVTALGLTGTHIAIYQSGTIVDIGRAAECRFWTEFEASGILQGDDFLAVTDVLSSGDILGTSPTRFIRAFPIWRFADTGDNDVFAPADIFTPTDVFAADVDWGEWVSIASGTRVSRYFEPGFVLITDEETVDATGTKFAWFVDVPDRTDDYTELSVPDTGLAVTFYPGGYHTTPGGGQTATPFNGGPNGSTVPHVQRAQVDNTNGDEVKITSLTLSGCTVHVVNAGSNVTRTGVNLLIRGY